MTFHGPKISATMWSACFEKRCFQFQFLLLSLIMSQHVFRSLFNYNFYHNGAQTSREIIHCDWAFKNVLLNWSHCLDAATVPTQGLREAADRVLVRPLQDGRKNRKSGKASLGSRPPLLPVLLDPRFAAGLHLLKP